MSNEKNSDGWRKNCVTFATDDDDHFATALAALKRVSVEGDTMRTGMSLKDKSFSAALAALKMGKGARLPQWMPDVVIRAQFPEEGQKMTAPYLYVSSRFGCVPWRETEIELFAENWEIVD